MSNVSRKFYSDPRRNTTAASPAKQHTHLRTVLEYTQQMPASALASHRHTARPTHTHLSVDIFLLVGQGCFKGCICSLLRFNLQNQNMPRAEPDPPPPPQKKKKKKVWTINKVSEPCFSQVDCSIEQCDGRTQSHNTDRLRLHTWALISPSA